MMDGENLLLLIIAMNRGDGLLNRHMVALCRVLICLLTVLSTASFSYAEDKLPKINAFLGLSYSQPLKTFNPDETVSLYITFVEPIKKNTTLTVTWITPLGIHERTHTQTIKPANRDGLIYQSWLRLHKLGLFTRAFTMEDYDSSYPGQWRVLIHVNMEEVLELDFEMVNF
jgi:hypothetical protein